MRRLLVTCGAVWLALLFGSVGALGAAWLADWDLNVVDSASMSPEMPPGTLAVVAPVRPAAIEVGDVVTFTDPRDGEGLVLHRVVEVIGTEAGPVLLTQGDANVTPDPVLVPARSIEGRLLHSVPHLGTAVRALQPPAGPALLVGVPTLVFLASELRRAWTSRARRAARLASASGT